MRSSSRLVGPDRGVVERPRKRAAQSLAASLRSLLRSRKAHLSVSDIAARVEGGGLGPVLFVLTLPGLLPPPRGAVRRAPRTRFIDGPGQRSERLGTKDRPRSAAPPTIQGIHE